MSTSKKSISIGLAHEMFVTLKKEGFTAEMAEKIQKNPELAWEIVKLVSGSKLELRKPLTELQKFWKKLYKKYFNLDIDASSIQERKGKWAIFIAKGLTTQLVFDVLPFRKENGLYISLNEKIKVNDRTSYKDYVVYVNQNIKADEQFKNKSFNDLKYIHHKGITLMEYLMLELFYFEKTGNLLDNNTTTMCSGSRISTDGDTIVVYPVSAGEKLYINRGEVDYSSDRWRSREVFF